MTPPSNAIAAAFAAAMFSIGITPAFATGELSGISAIATGNDHSCALTVEGGVKCWGINNYGQLGDGTTSNRTLPVDVLGLTTGVVAISAGESHTCARTAAGGVKCWGNNSAGQLGDGTTSNNTIPFDVLGLATGVAAISAGGSHSCALTAAGEVMCWGWNAYGQLGNGTVEGSAWPVLVSGLAGTTSAISAGSAHTCALDAAGGARCWGYNHSGQLGDGTTTDRSTPTGVLGLGDGVAAISAGQTHTCARTSAGGAKCWGGNGDGQLGDGTNLDRAVPGDVIGLASGVAAIDAGGGVYEYFGGLAGILKIEVSQSCVLTLAGGVRCWGNNSYGQLGLGDLANRSTPADVPGSTVGMTAVAGGGRHSCALTPQGTVSCWGYKATLGASATTTTVSEVAGLASGVTAVAAGAGHNCAVTTTGAVKCWGLNNYGELGDGTTATRLVPADVSGIANGVTAIAASSALYVVPTGMGRGREYALSHSCALTSAGGVKCWGVNSYGQLGDGTTTTRLSPVDVPGLAGGVRAVATGYDHTCVLTSSGGVRCWGRSTWLTPTDLPLFGSGNLAIASGGTEACALTAAGGVKCGIDYPTNVPGLASGVVAISIGNSNEPLASPSAYTGVSHKCALAVSGGLKCWGNNNHGQLGDGTTTDASIPINVIGLATGVAAVAAGYKHTCALTTMGAVKCWGYGWGSTPIDVPGLSSGVAAISAGGHHNCALTLAGGVKCWGDNGYGQWGDGTTYAVRAFPAPVMKASSVTVDVKGARFGTVASSPAGIDCGQACAADFPAGTVVTLTATPVAYSNFLGWSGSGCSGGGTCVLTVAATTNAGVTAAFSTPPGRLANISTRGRVETGDNVLIGGFIIDGTVPKKVLIRARGPSLAAYGVNGALANPVLQLYSGQAVIASNDDWGNAPNVADIKATGVAPTDPLESAILTTVDPGPYTAIVSGAGASGGVGIVEVFEIGYSDVRLANISTRGLVQTGDSVMIGGFIIQGEAPKKVLITARGPSLSASGVPGVLANPFLQLFSGQAVIASNDDWIASPNVTAIQAIDVAPKNPLESAILITLNPGAYTAIVSGAGGGTGVGIVEVFAQ